MKVHARALRLADRAPTEPCRDSAKLFAETSSAAARCWSFSESKATTFDAGLLMWKPTRRPRFALAWGMRDGNVTAIPESGAPVHVKENAVALSLPLTPQDLQTLEAAYPARARAN